MSVAKNCPETPRQRLIGMMYLVLTAMLALNVSKEVLNGFTMVDNSLHSTIESSDIRNNVLYNDFQFLNQQNPQKVGEWLIKADSVKTQSDSLYNYIQNFKENILKISDGDKADPKARIIINKDNLDAAGDYAILKGNGKILKEKIDNYRNFLVDLAKNDSDKRQMYMSLFNTNKIYSRDTKEKKPWEDAVFDMMPVSAVVTILTKYQSDIRSSEAEMVQYLKNMTDAKDYRVNSIKARVIPNSRFVFRGERYSAQFVLSAIDSTKKPDYYVNGVKLSNSDGKYEFVANRLGPGSYSGEIKMSNGAGGFVTYPFHSDYMVGEPSATISNEDLNVVYKGFDNRFSVSVPGVAPENVRISIDGGNYINKGKGKYIIHPTRDNQIRINVFGKIDNKEMSMGYSDFRVKHLPRPSVFVLDKKGNEVEDEIPLDELRGSSIIASYGPDALIQAKFSIISFTMIVEGLAPKTISGSKLDLSFLNQLSKGKNLILSNIKAIGPDKEVRTLSATVIRIL